MTQWTASNPSAGSPTDIRAAAGRRQTDASTARAAGGDATTAGGIVGSGWQGLAATALQTTTAGFTGELGAISGYTPNPDVQIYATQSSDDINRYYAGIQAGDLGFGVTPESIPGVTIVDSGIQGQTVTPGELPNVAESIDHHNALMSDDLQINGTVLREVRNLLDGLGADQ